MNATTMGKTIGKATRVESLLAVLVALAAAILFSLAVGLPTAYAAEGDNPSAGTTGGENSALNQLGANEPNQPAGGVVAGDGAVVANSTGTADGIAAGGTAGTLADGQATAGISNVSTNTSDGPSDSPGADSLQAAANSGDPGYDVPQDIVLWLSPKGATGTQIEGTNDIMVELTCAVGEGVHVGAEVYRVQIEGKDTAAGDTVIFYDNTWDRFPLDEEANMTGTSMICLYDGQRALLDQGSYSDKGTPVERPGSLSVALGGTNASALYYISRPSYSMSPPPGCFAAKGSANLTRVGLIGTYSAGDHKVGIPYMTIDKTGWSEEELYFDKAGEHYITAQATIAEIFLEWTSSGYLYEWHVVHASNRVIFKVNVTDNDTANLVLKAKDPSGNDIDLSNDFTITWQKKIGINENDGSYQEKYSDWWPVRKGTTWRRAPEGTYKVNITSDRGLYVPFEAELTVSASEVAGDTLEKLVTIVPKDYIPQYDVTFVAEDGSTVLLAATPYNKDTVGRLVVTPTNVPAIPEDDDYKYVHYGWTIADTGEYVSSPVNVTRDVTYKAYYKPIPKKNVNTSPLRIIASGGLYALTTMPAKVVSYGLQASTPTAAQSSALASAYAANIGNSKVLGMYNVDVIQHNEDGSDVSLHEGVGDMTLTFPVDGVADGTALRVLQLHENGDSTQLIEHTGLVASGGTVDVTLDGRLSTFIILEDVAVEEEPTAGGNGSGDSGSGGNGAAGEGSGEGAAGSEGANGAKGSEGPEASKGSEGAATGEDAVEVKAMAANPAAVGAVAAAGAAQLPETGDDLGMLIALLLATMAGAVACALAIRNARAL